MAKSYLLNTLVARSPIMDIGFFQPEEWRRVKAKCRWIKLRGLRRYKGCGHFLKKLETASLKVILNYET